ncbi:MAG TPA: PAS domain S-box protein, partial [Flavisolibacter sp.]|nr:PAS domain S-box protein [Flavisolibacter sp.]
MPHRFPSLALLLKLHDAVNEIICVIDKEGSFIYLNQACKRIWGYEPSDLIGLKCFQLLIEEDQSSAINLIQVASQEGHIHTFENHYYRKDGTIATMFWQGGWDPLDQLLYCTGRDITEQKRLEQAEQDYKVELKRTKESLENLLDRITDGFIGLDEHARVTYWNKAAEAISLISRSEILGKALWDVIPDPMAEIYRQSYREV